ncbi:amino-acid N-acetyltransferase, partial [Tremellales sp. Uapishka_1]
MASFAPSSSSTSPASPSKPYNPLVTSLLNPVAQRPALVKIQGPFTDIQLNSVARGMTQLRKLGLVSVIVIDRDDIPPVESTDHERASRQRTLILRDVERLVGSLVKHRTLARPILSTAIRMHGDDIFVEEEGLDHIRRALQEGEIPVLLPVALDEGCKSRRIDSDKVLVALAKAMSAAPPCSSPGINLTPLRLLIINREGGIPSYARNGYPHLSINLASEYEFIQSTFLPQWRDSHPTSLSNLQLARDCLSYMPKQSSALIVSHRSPAALIANLITNKPAHSVSLPHSLLTQSEGRITRDTPTLIRKGLPVRVLRSFAEIDTAKLTTLLEKSFGRTLDQARFYDRLRSTLDFMIVIGDEKEYAGAALCTLEDGICYLDKFAVLPSNQGDGTVDFLWVALRDETYGLGLADSANSNEGSLKGQGRGRDLVWRSRANNPVNKWYYERSSGFVTLPQGNWKMFWCDAEQKVGEYGADRERTGEVRVVESDEAGRLQRWSPTVEGIGSAWL